MKTVFIFVLFISAILIGTNELISQSDNPNLDQPPRQYWDHVSNVMPRPVSVITDNSGYDNFDLGVDFAEVHISENPRNPLWFFLAYNTNATYYSLNGIDWLRNNPSFPNSAGDPVTAYDSLGNLYYDNMKSPITGTWTVRSTNNGLTWSTAVSANIGNDKNWIAADQTGGPFANYIYGGMTPGNFVRSTDNGASFANTFSASNSLPGTMVCVGPNIIGGNVSGGCVYLVTNTGSSFTPTWTFNRSTDGGSTFNFMSSQNYANYVGTNVGGRNSIQNMRTRPYPFIGADNSYGSFRGRLYLIYASNNPGGDGNKPDIYCRYSTDQGASWSAEVVVNDDINSQNNNQWHPAMWCDKETGRLYVQWMDTRDCPTSDSALIYASYSTNGGATFVANQQISTKKMRINCTTCGGGGTPAYLGDYNSVISNSVTSTIAWADFRNNNFGSYVAYFPDYAMKTSTPYVNVNNGQNVSFNASIPSVKAYTGKVKFTAVIDTLPSGGTLNVSFVGKDSVTSFPDSVLIKVEAIGTVTPGRYRLKVEARGPNGTPAHRRVVDVLVNSSYLTVGTNRPGIADFRINGTTYNQTQQLPFVNGSLVTVQAVSPRTIGNNQYVFSNWSDGGDTTHTVTINSNTNLTATYKIQYRLLISSAQGNTFGGNLYYDSTTNATFGVNSRIVINAGITYYFRGWTGLSPNSYTSPDSTGLDSVVVLAMVNPMVETARWTTTSSINQISSVIPEKYSLYNNYPNPFNPVTLIKFDVAKNQLVTLKIYNLLGEEVAVLIDQNMTPGRYTVDFNASPYSSGIYFYHLETQGFADTKRMVLIK
ncbi:MAG: T9SS type A sorting domain-containing protein [Ignavibacteria bacterium]